MQEVTGNRTRPPLAARRETGLGSRNPMNLMHVSDTTRTGDFLGCLPVREFELGPSLTPTPSIASQWEVIRRRLGDL